MTVNYVISCIVGIVYGALVGTLKYFILWHKILHAPADDQVSNSKVYGNMGISYLINIVSLLIILFLKDVMPFDFVATIAAAAITISFAGRFYPLTKIFKRVK